MYAHIRAHNKLQSFLQLRHHQPVEQLRSSVEEVGEVKRKMKGGGLKEKKEQNRHVSNSCTLSTTHKINWIFESFHAVRIQSIASMKVCEEDEIG
jgi:hypothetical protein